MVPYIFKGWQQAGVVKSYRAVGNPLLLTLDGTRYFSSQQIHCPYCSTQQHANGSVTYFHLVCKPGLIKRTNSGCIRPRCEDPRALVKRFGEKK